MNQQYIGKLLPAQGYFILFQGNISTTHFQSLTHLYQPLIGSQAVSLYQTLLSEYEIKRGIEIPQTHHTLMNYLSLPLDEIYKARLKLEGIGLLETFKQDTDHETVYMYKLNLPFSPIEFFSNGMLSQLLYHHLGGDKCDQLYQAFKEKYPNKVPNGENITASFTEVFNTQAKQFDENSVELTKKKVGSLNSGPNIESETIDFEWIVQMLEQRMLPVEKIMTASNKQLIAQMAVLYDLTNQDVEKAVLWAIGDENTLNITEFKSACVDLLQSRQQKVNIKLIDRKTSIKLSNDDQKKQPQSKQDQFIQMLEQISPRQLLEDLSGGNEASTQDLKMIGDVMTQQGLAPGVMNVLIHYVLLKTDMKLTKTYIEKIASHWARKNVKTVRQAMTLAKSENNKYQQWGNKKQQYYKNSNKKEVIPEWFKERNQAVNSKTETKKPEANEQKEDIAELLKKYKSNKSNHL